MPSYSETIVSALLDELGAAAFDIRVDTLPGTDQHWVLAEDEHFLVGSLVTETVEQLIQIEPAASVALLERVRGGEPEAKQWDVYLLLLCADIASSPIEREAVASITESLRGLRRVIALGVAGSADVHRAVTPFVPLPQPTERFEVNALEAVRDELVVNGVSADAAARYIAVFRQEGHLRDV